MFDNIVNNLKTTNLVNETQKELDQYKMKIEPNAFYIGIVTNTNDSYKLR